MGRERSYSDGLTEKDGKRGLRFAGPGEFQSGNEL